MQAQLNFVPFDPRQIGGLRVWIDASQYTGGANVTALTDLAENVGYTVGGVPTYSATNFASPLYGGMPGFNTAGGRFFRALTTAFSGFQHTCFMVGSISNLTGNGFPALALATTTSGSVNFFRCLDTATAGPSFRSIAFGSAVLSYSNAQTTSPFLFDETYNGASILVPRIYYGGNAFESWTLGGTTTSFGNSNAAAVFIGTDGFSNNQSSNYWPGIISEVIMYSDFLPTVQRQQVEGYLAWKWGLQNSLPANHPFRNLLTNTFSFASDNPPSVVRIPTIPLSLSFASFSPLSIPGSILWLDAADTTTFTGGSTWFDKSATPGNNGVGTGVAGTSMPTVGTWTNGLQAAVFTRTSATVGTSMMTNSATNPANTYSLFIAMRLTALVSPAAEQFIFINNVEGARQIKTISTAFPASINIQFNNTLPLLTIPTTVAQNQGFILSYMVPAAAGTGNGYLNGLLPPTGQAITTSSASRWYFGSANNSADRYFTGQIGEIIAYNSLLSDLDRQDIEGYLAWKWDIQTRLAPTHPFRNFPPPPL